VINKLSSGYHNISSFITFSKLHDVILVTKTKKSKDEINFTGKFKKGIHKKFNTIIKVLNLLRKYKLIENQSFKIRIQKNIPHGSGLGGGSSNAADLLNYFNHRMKLNLGKKKLKKIATQIGFDVPISLEKKNTFLTGKREEMLRFNKKLGLNLLIVYPNFICSTKKIFKKNKKKSLPENKYFMYFKDKKKLFNLLKNDKNDLEETITKIYPKIKKIISYIGLQEGCIFSRITGSGSACIGIFSNMKNAIYAKRLIKLKYPNYWCVVSKTI